MAGEYNCTKYKSPFAHSLRYVSVWTSEPNSRCFALLTCWYYQVFRTSAPCPHPHHRISFCIISTSAGHGGRRDGYDSNRQSNKRRKSPLDHQRGGATITTLRDATPVDSLTLRIIHSRSSPGMPEPAVLPFRIPGL